MDPLLAADRLPRLAERAMRAAIVSALARGRMTPRALIDAALVGFEAAVMRHIGEGIRPALLFGERDRIVRELRGFIDGRLAARLGALHRRDLLALGRDAAPFDAIVRNRQGRSYAVVFRRLPRDGRRLELLRRIHVAAQMRTRTPVDGVLVYDFSAAAARLLLGQAGAEGVYRHLRAS
jgi:hypothetical protein